jgi:hypothetical protein
MHHDRRAEFVASDREGTALSAHSVLSHERRTPMAGQAHLSQERRLDSRGIQAVFRHVPAFQRELCVWRPSVGVNYVR